MTNEEKLAKTLSHFATVDDWIQWRKEQFQKKWEEESLKAYEDSRSGRGDDDTQQGSST